LKGEISLHAKFPGEVAFHNEAAPGANKATCFSLPENGHAISVKTKLAVHLYTSSLFSPLGQLCIFVLRSRKTVPYNHHDLTPDRVERG
jgi:hypothetical protein